MTTFHRSIGFAIALAVLLPSAAPAQSGASSASPATAPATQPAHDRTALEARFQETMTGSVLVGRFSDFNRPDAPPKEERYVIQRVSKLPGGGDRWLFLCRIQFGKKDVSVPLAIPVVWAGDTPVISVTDMAIPGLGSYTARVMIYDNAYAGTWGPGKGSGAGGGKRGGHLWGRIERDAASTQPATGPATAPAAP